MIDQQITRTNWNNIDPLAPHIPMPGDLIRIINSTDRRYPSGRVLLIEGRNGRQQSEYIICLHPIPIWVGWQHDEFGTDITTHGRGHRRTIPASEIQFTGEYYHIEAKRNLFMRVEQINLVCRLFEWSYTPDPSQ